MLPFLQRYRNQSPRPDSDRCPHLNRTSRTWICMRPLAQLSPKVSAIFRNPEKNWFVRSTVIEAGAAVVGNTALVSVKSHAPAAAQQGQPHHCKGPPPRVAPCTVVCNRAYTRRGQKACPRIKGKDTLTSKSCSLDDRWVPAPDSGFSVRAQYAHPLPGSPSGCAAHPTPEKLRCRVRRRGSPHSRG